MALWDYVPLMAQGNPTSVMIEQGVGFSNSWTRFYCKAFLTRSGFMQESTGNLRCTRLNLTTSSTPMLIFIVQGGGGVGARCDAETRAM
eukprot:3941167-Rhodomonas_salina.1